MQDAVKHLSQSELSKIATIAQLYYEKGEKQHTIAKALGVSQTEISRCLKLGHEYGIVQVYIDPSLTADLASSLRTAFPHLQDVVIVPVADLPGQRDDAHFLQELGTAGARYLLEHAHHAAKIGISCGYGVEAVINAIGPLRAEGTPLPIACGIYPLLILMMPELVQVTPAALVANLVRHLPDATGKVFQLPQVSEEQLSFYTDNAQIRQLLEEIHDLDYYVLGIGYIDYEGKSRHGRHRQQMVTHEFNALIWKLDLIEILAQLGAEGEVLYQPFDAQGEQLIGHPALRPLRNSVLYLSLDILRTHVHASRERKKTDARQKKIIAVAGGQKKHKAILAALRAALCNVLVTDSVTADTILRAQGITPTAAVSA